MTTQEGGRWESHSMKRLTPLLQGSYQHCKWQTVAGVITRRAWAWLQGRTCSAREKGGAWDGTKYVCICGTQVRNR